MSGKRGHFRRIQQVLLIVLGLNWAVAAAKIIYGLMSHSASMTADGFHSLADGTSNIIGIVGIVVCSQPRDKDHPYGHKKYETLFAFGIAAMLIFVAFNLAKEGIHRIVHPMIPEVDVVSFIVMIVTMVVNIGVMIFEYRQGSRMKSDILIVDSMHTRADIFTSLSVIAALIFVAMGFPIMDPVITLLIAGFIAYSAYEIIKQESRILCDAAVIEDTKLIERVVLGVAGVTSCHKIRSRGRPDDVYLDMHVQVNGAMSLQEAHDLSHTIQHTIASVFPQVTDVIVHMEPKEGA